MLSAQRQNRDIMSQLLVTPEFYRRFQCIGTECESSCCQGWTVTIDKATCKSYLESPHSEIRELARQHLDISKSSPANWATIKLDNQGHCPFLADNGLCKVHLQAGAEALSQTCKTYPRLTPQYGALHLRSLTLSCPEACRLILLDPKALECHSEPWSEKGHSGKKGGQSLPEWAELLHQCSLQLLLNPQLGIEQRLFFTGMLINQCQGGDVTQRSDIVHAFFASISQLLEQEQWQPLFAQVPFIGQIQWNILSRLGALIKHAGSRANGRGSAAMLALYQQLCDFFGEQYDEQKLQQLQLGWQQQALPWLMTHQPQLLDNYLGYYLYQHHFPSAEPQKIVQAYHQLLADYFLLRNLLSLMALQPEGLTTDRVIALFHSYHTHRQHNVQFGQILAECLRSADVPADLAAYALLKFA